jgi:hypothetical protein
MGKSIEKVIFFTGKVHANSKKKKKNPWEIAAVRQSRSTILDINQKDIRK